MLNRVQKVLQKNCALNSYQPIIVGVSGGADSLTLLNIMAMGYSVVVAHFNHLLRPEASEDAQTVKRIAITKGIPIALGEGAAVDYAREHTLSIEEAAREVRYRFLFEQASLHNAQAVAVAHNADDQVETVLMHLLRGAGLDGLTGMPYRLLPNPWSEAIPLIRPLLSVWRTEIDAYCIENGIVPVVDQSNVDPVFFRNQLRHILIPEMETYIHGFRTRLWQTADLLSGDREVLDTLVEGIWPSICNEVGRDYLCFDQEAFNSQPVGIKRRLIRKSVSHLRPGLHDLNFSMVQRVIVLSTQPTFIGQTDIGLGLRAFLEAGKLVIATWEADLPKAHWPQIHGPMSLTIPGEVGLGVGWLLRAEIVEDLEVARQEAYGNQNPYEAWIDLEDRQTHLSVRPRSTGERFRPMGMGGKRMKISDFMINQKIPRRARAGWPLVCVGDEIAWIPGFRLGHSFVLGGKTRQVVKLSLRSI